jgi:hypothetical protein
MTVRYLGIILLAFFFTGCAQLTSGQEQPVLTRNAKEGIYYTTCSGAVENFSTCNAKAMKRCTKGYVVVENYQDSNGTIRSITFQCNK